MHSEGFQPAPYNCGAVVDAGKLELGYKSLARYWWNWHTRDKTRKRKREREGGRFSTRAQCPPTRGVTFHYTYYEMFSQVCYICMFYEKIYETRSLTGHWARWLFCLCSFSRESCTALQLQVSRSFVFSSTSRCLCTVVGVELWLDAWSEWMSVKQECNYINDENYCCCHWNTYYAMKECEKKIVLNFFFLFFTFIYSTLSFFLFRFSVRRASNSCEDLHKVQNNLLHF